MRSRRKLMVLTVIVAAVMVVTALPAAAGKGGKPGKGDDTAFYDVTFALVDDASGLASSCPGPLTMAQGRGRAGSTLGANGDGGTSYADLYYRGPGLEDGCYTGIAEGSTTSDAQFLRIERKKSGELFYVDWFFDVDVTEGVTHKYWLKSLDVSAGPGPWESGRQVSGTFELWDFTRGADGEPVWTLLATPELMFDMTIVPLPGS